jgi:hypothetical protein
MHPRWVHCIYVSNEEVGQLPRAPHRIGCLTELYAARPPGGMNARTLALWFACLMCVAGVVSGGGWACRDA